MPAEEPWITVSRGMVYKFEEVLRKDSGGQVRYKNKI